MRSVVEYHAWWPAYLVALKLVIGFLNLKAYREAMTDKLKHNMSGLATAIGQHRASFAKWRWHTLANCLSALMKLKEAGLEAGWAAMVDSNAFMNCKDKVGVQTMNAVVVDGLFGRRTRYLKASVCEMDHARTWGSGCTCCEEALLRREKVQCVRNGMRMGEAWAKVCSVVEVFTNWSKEATLADWAGDHDAYVSAANGLKFAAGYINQKFKHFNELPYSLVGLLKPGMAAQLRKEYNDTPEHLRHRVSRRFFDPLGVFSRPRMQLKLRDRARIAMQD